MAQLLKYPSDVDTGRTHLSITAFEYKLPTLQGRDAIGRPTVTGANQVGTPRGATTTSTTGSTTTGAFGISTEDAQRTIEADVYNNNVAEPVAAARLGPPLYTILTYIPAGFGDTVNATWADETVALVGNPAAVKVNKENFAGLQRGDTSGLSGMIDVFAGAANAAMLGKFEQLTASGPLAAVRVTAEAAIGRRIVPNTAKVFKGADGISLPLNLVMAPRNSDEGKEMISIIDLLRQSAIPFIDPTEDVKVEKIGVVQFFQYPPIFTISVIPGGAGSVTSGQFFEYRAMALTSFGVSYSDNTSVYTYFHDNVPTRATLTLQFNSIFPVFQTGGKIGGR